MTHHRRRQIRDRAKAQLLGLPSTGAEVYIGRTRELKQGHAPTWLVYARTEGSDVDTQGGGSTLLRNLALLLEGRANAEGETAAEDLENLLDDMAAEAEGAMALDFSLNGLATEVTLTGTEIETIAAGELHQGRIALRYRVVYRTLETDPTQPV